MTTLGEVGAASGASSVAADRVLPAPSFRDLFQRLGNQHAADGLLPTVLFIGLNAAYGLSWGIAGATVAALGAALRRQLRGETTSKLVWVSLAFVVVRGGAGIVTNSEAVYFGPGIVTAFLIAAGFAGSVCIGRPALAAMANALYPLPEEARADPVVRRTFNRLTLMFAVSSALSGVMQLWFLQTMTANQFMLANRAYSWTTTPLLIAVTLRGLRSIVTRSRVVLASA